MNNNIHRIVTVLICVLIQSATFAQVKIDTVYIKADKETTKDSASFYRVRTISEGIFKAEDFSIKDRVKKCSGYYKSFDPYVKNGYFIFYSNDSLVHSEGNYKEDKMDGIWKNYYSSGELWYIRTFVEGVKNGLTKGYYKTGELKRIEEYENGERIIEECYTKAGKDTVYYEIYIMPVFPGGEKARVEYFQNHILYPKKARREKIQGIVYVSFIVNTDGSIHNVEIVKGKGVDPLLDNEAIRCVKDMPVWTPGYVDGVPMNTRMITRLKFTLDE